MLILTFMNSNLLNSFLTIRYAEEVFRLVIGQSGAYASARTKAGIANQIP
jgi:hypothetical protein